MDDQGPVEGQRSAKERASGAGCESTAADGDASVWLLSGDLMFASRVRGAAERVGLRFRLSGSLPSADGTRADSTGAGGGSATEERPKYVILDLATRASLTEQVVAWVREHHPGAIVIAYGPHVQAARLKAAREAGIERVMTRAQFDAALATLFDR